MIIRPKQLDLINELCKNKKKSWNVKLKGMYLVY